MSPSNGSQLQSSSPSSPYSYNMLERVQIFLHQEEKIWIFIFQSAAVLRITSGLEV